MHVQISQKNDLVWNYLKLLEFTHVFEPLNVLYNYMKRVGSYNMQLEVWSLRKMTEQNRASRTASVRRGEFFLLGQKFTLVALRRGKLIPPGRIGILYVSHRGENDFARAKKAQNWKKK